MNNLYMSFLNQCSVDATFVLKISFKNARVITFRLQNSSFCFTRKTNKTWAENASLKNVGIL